MIYRVDIESSGVEGSVPEDGGGASTGDGKAGCREEVGEGACSTRESARKRAGGAGDTSGEAGVGDGAVGNGCLREIVNAVRESNRSKITCTLRVCICLHAVDLCFEGVVELRKAFVDGGFGHTSDNC